MMMRMMMMMMNWMTIMTTSFVCVIQPILKQDIAVVMPKARIAMANVAQTDTTGGSILETFGYQVKVRSTNIIHLKTLKEISLRLTYG